MTLDIEAIEAELAARINSFEGLLRWRNKSSAHVRALIDRVKELEAENRGMKLVMKRMRRHWAGPL